MRRMDKESFLLIFRRLQKTAEKCFFFPLFSELTAQVDYYYYSDIL